MRALSLEHVGNFSRQKPVWLKVNIGKQMYGKRRDIAMRTNHQTTALKKPLSSMTLWWLSPHRPYRACDKAYTALFICPNLSFAEASNMLGALYEMRS